MLPENWQAQLPDNWWVQRNAAETFITQLKQELPPRHCLYGLKVKFLARIDGQDDVLFLIDDGSGRVAEVHLTWSKRQERLPWPIGKIYDNFQTWKAEKLKNLQN